MKNSNDKKTGLVLAGGGANGAFQAHIIDKMFHEKKWDVIAGISAGALNGSVVSMNSGLYLSDMWKDIRFNSIYGGLFSKWGFIGKIAHVIRMLYGTGKYNGLYNMDNIRSMLNEIYDPSKQFEDTRFVVGVADLYSQTYSDIHITKDTNKQQAIESIVASASIPILTQTSNKVNGIKHGVDGGLHVISPIKTAIKNGADTLTIIVNRSTNRKPVPVNGIQSVLTSTFETILDSKFKRDLSHVIEINKIIRERSSKSVQSAGDKEVVAGKTRKYIDIKLIHPTKDAGDALDFSKSAYEHRKQLVDNGDYSVVSLS